MADEEKLRAQSTRGKRAEALLKNELLVEAFVKIESDIYEGWRLTSADEHEQRQNAYLMHRLLQVFKTHFESIVRTGDHAGKMLELEREKG